MSISNIAKNTFANKKNTQSASNYLEYKKIKNIYCKLNKCNSNIKLTNESELINQEIYKSIVSKNDIATFNKMQLYSNLYTKLDLTDISQNIPVICDASNNSYPVTINSIDNMYLNYTIDPSGILFGNTICTNNNYLNFVVFNS